MNRTVIALDPGRTTGVSVLINRGLSAFIFKATHQQLRDFLVEYEPNTIIYERFDYRPHQVNADLYPVELIGVIKLYCQDTGCEEVPQKQLKGHRGFWTDDKLKALDLYKVGEQGHSNDALRQMLYYITFDLGNDYYVQQLSRVTD
jgi:hypothetical protein